MSEIFSRRTFLKGSAALVGATALAAAMGGCSGSSKTTIKAPGFADIDSSTDAETDDSDYTVSGPSAPSNPGVYSIGGGIELAGMVGVLCTKPRGYTNKYPGFTLVLKNNSDEDLVINASQFTDAHFDGKAVPIAGLKLDKDSANKVIFTQTMTIYKGHSDSVFLYLDAPASDLARSGQPTSFAFALTGTKKVRISGKYSGKDTFTITY